MAPLSARLSDAFSLKGGRRGNLQQVAKKGGMSEERKHFWRESTFHKSTSLILLFCYCRQSFPTAQSANCAAAATMIGAMPAVAVRHERRKQGGKTTASSLLGLQKGGGAGGGGSRPNALLLKPHLSKGAGGGVGAGDGHTPGVGSR